jgi:hypothetical protein
VNGWQSATKVGMQRTELRPKAAELVPEDETVSVWKNLLAGPDDSDDEDDWIAMAGKKDTTKAKKEEPVRQEGWLASFSGTLCCS